MRKRTTLLFFACTLLTQVYAAHDLSGDTADRYVKGAGRVVLKDESAVPSFISFRPENYPASGNPESWLRLSFHLDTGYGLREISKDPDQLGYTHHRYQQTWKGIPLDGTMWITHEKNNAVVSMNGQLEDHLKGGETPVITEQDALHRALEFLGAKSYKWQFPEEEAALKRVLKDPGATYRPHAELIYAFDSRKSGPPVYRLAYRFDIYAQEPLARKYISVDVVSGEIVDVQDRIREANANGTAVTVYAGTQPIVTDNFNGIYRLREAGRGAGQGMETYNLQQGTVYSTAVDFTDADNYWNNVNAAKDQYATDAHFAAEKTYDYYYTNYGRNSIDNAGLKLISYVHYSTNYVNAFWDGTEMTYGDGNATYSPLVSLDIGGHEITHGLTEHTANLVYANESGALNESFSDCFGTSVEFFADPAHADWLIGEDIGAPFRSHSNPNAYGDPDTYLGTNWYTGTADNGGVHTNSGVQNFWFYLLSVGGTGTNDIGNAYTVTGIGITKAAAITFRSLTVYLTSTAQYADARFYAIQAASDLYGPCSPEALATADAWYAVGVGPASNSPVTATAGGPLTFCNSSSVTLTATAPSGSTYQWYRNGSILPGATTSTFSATLDGSYTVGANHCGTPSTSTPISVTVIQVNPTISPAGPVSSCNNVLLTAGNTGGYNIQWNKDGVPVSGATASSYSASQSGNYTFTLSSSVTPGQTAGNTTLVSIPDNTCSSPAASTIHISGLPAAFNTGGITVQVHLTHTYDGDLDLLLEAPNGDVLGLSHMAGGAGDNFTNTIFSDAGAGTISTGSAPFTGTFKPWASVFSSCISSTKTSFGSIGNGSINPNGDWILHVYDRGPADLGTIDNWSITFPSITTPSPDCGPVTSPGVSVNIGNSASVTAGPNASIYYEWTAKSNFPGTPRAFGVSASLNGKGYFGTGDNTLQADWWEYNPGNDTWTQKANCPQARSGGASFSLNGKAYIIGGYNAGFLNTVYEWDPGANTWTAKAAFAGTARSRMASCAINGKGYIFGGTTAAGSAQDVWEFDPSLNQWNFKINIPASGANGRTTMSAFVLFSKAYFGLGQTCGSPCTPAYVNDWFEYDPAANSIIQKNNFPGPAREGACAFTLNSKGYLAFGNANTSYYSDLWEYDALLDAWTARTSWSGSGRGGSSSFTVNNTAYVVGGNANGSPVTDVLQLKTVSHLCTNTPASVTLQASAGTSYSWSTGATTQTITGPAGGDYSVTVVNAACSATAYSSIAVYPVPAPTVSVTGPLTFCPGGAATLTSSSANGYLWNTGSTASAITVTQSGFYSVVVTGAGGCTNTSSAVTITRNPPPAVTVVPTGSTGICQGSSATLTAYGYQSIPFAPVAGTGTSVTLADDQLSTALPIGFSFTFFGNVYTNFYISSNGFITFTGNQTSGCCSGQLLPNAATPNNLIAFAWTDLYPPGGGTIQYFTTGTAPNRKLIMNFNAIPHYSSGYLVTAQVVLLEGSNEIEIHTTAMPANTSLHTMGLENASGTQAVIIPGRNSAVWSAANEALRFSPGNATYLWSTGSAASAISTTLAGTYTVTATSAFGCTATSSVAVTVNPLPTATITAGGPLAFCSGGSVTLTAGGGSGYAWSNGATTAAITVTTGGTYTVTVSSAAGCTATASRAVTVNSLPTAIASSNSPVCEGSALNLTSGGGVSYSWTGPGGFNSSAQNPVLNNISSANAGTYTVTVTGGNGCTSTTTATVVTKSCALALSLHVYLEGYFDPGSGFMRTTLWDLWSNDGIGNPTTDADATDTIEADLYAPANASSGGMTPDYSVRTVLHKDGIAQASFANAPRAFYYLSVKHRTGVETWSRAPVDFTGGSAVYDFTNSLSAAYDDGTALGTAFTVPPMHLLANGRYGIYSGDCNRDGTMDILDMSEVYNDARAGFFGYSDDCTNYPGVPTACDGLASDCNGDGAGDILDMGIIYNNSHSLPGFFYSRPGF